MQQVCPMCRAEIPADGPLLNGTPAPVPEDTGLAAAAAAAAAAQAQVPASQPSQSASSDAVSSSNPRSNGEAREPVPEVRNSGPSVSKPGASLAQLTAGASNVGITGNGASASTAPTHLPPLQEILDALGRAEEVAMFLREQQSFWMDQVRQIQNTVSQGPPSAGEAAPAVATMQGHALSGRGNGACQSEFPGCLDE